ncbi:hypothetical protein Aazo_2980 ['Nostoc azollae' 0708]|jgi:hypothetical protein|uniref:Uncharacterized protein n=1 Tax=Nostoc azollae (strain 0708) TaxID=551115 RepID=D7E1A0_NOSA0|nr:hypothetical protein Aazo_2980 ['Nostoc azollae' 0708]
MPLELQNLTGGYTVSPIILQTGGTWTYVILIAQLISSGHWVNAERALRRL